MHFSSNTLDYMFDIWQALPITRYIAIGPLSLQLGLFIALAKIILFTYRQKQSILLFKWPFSA